MDYTQFMEKIRKLQELNTEEAYTNIIKLVDEQLKELDEKGLLSQILATKKKISTLDFKGLAKDAKTVNDKKELSDKLNLIKENAKVSIVEVKLANNTDKKRNIKLQGELIKAYKKIIPLEKDTKKVYEVRHKIVELLQKQRDDMKDYRQTADNVSLPSEVALRVKEISNLTKVFLEKKDVIIKIKNMMKESVVGGFTSAILVTGMAAAIQATTGLPTIAPALASVVPLFAYTALTSGMRNFSTQTGFQQYEYFQSDEYKEYLKKFKEENKEKLNEIGSLIKIKEECTSNEEMIQTNETLINKLDELCKGISVQGLRDAYALQALGYYRENKAYCKEMVNEYLNEENNDQEKYQKYNDKLMKTNLQIFLRENSLKEALRSAGKNVVKNTAIMALAKAIVTAVVPESSIAIHGISSFILPVAMAITNGIVEIPTYNGKLKYRETSDNVKIDVKEEEKFNKLFDNYSLKVA